MGYSEQPRVADNLGLSDILPELIMPADLHALIPAQQQLPLAIAAPAADRAAAAALFATYRERRAANTVRAHDADLACFAQYLAAAGVCTDPCTDLSTAPDGWRGMTWGIVAGFVAWQVQQGYAVGSINRALSTVKAYARLATQAGSIPPGDYIRIKAVPGYRHAEGRRLDARRKTTRKGAKKAAPVSIGPDQAGQLKDRPDPRDRLLMGLLLDHGLRVGEVAALTPAAFDLDRGVLRFYRSKVDKVQQHRLSKDTLAAAEAYIPVYTGDAPLFGSDRTIRRRVGQLGAAIGLAGLSPHDLRHYWATAATRAGTPLKALQDAGGWSSPAMPLRYAESAEIANDGVKLD